MTLQYSLHYQIIISEVDEGFAIISRKNGNWTRNWAIQWDVLNICWIVYILYMLNCISRNLCIRKHILLFWPVFPVFTYSKINVFDILSLLWNSGISWSTAAKQQLIIKIYLSSSTNLMQRMLRNPCFCGSLTSTVTAKAVLVILRPRGIMALYR